MVWWNSVLPIWFLLKGNKSGPFFVKKYIKNCPHRVFPSRYICTRIFKNSNSSKYNREILRQIKYSGLWASSAKAMRTVCTNSILMEFYAVHKKQITAINLYYQELNQLAKCIWTTSYPYFNQFPKKYFRVVILNYSTFLQSAVVIK